MNQTALVLFFIENILIAQLNLEFHEKSNLNYEDLIFFIFEMSKRKKKLAHLNLEVQKLSTSTFHIVTRLEKKNDRLHNFVTFVTRL